MYIMGLWLSDLSNGLLWSSWIPEHRESRREIAPSWCWLSCGMVSHEGPRCDETKWYGESRVPTFFFLSALDKSISPFPLLRVLGSLMSVECVVDSASSFSGRYVRVCDQRLPHEEPLDEAGTERDPLRLHSIKVDWDLEVEPSYLDRTFPCLICVTENYKGYGYPRGLVLECVSPEIKLYRRMGVFKASYYHEYWRDVSVSEKLCGLEREEIYIK
jgi:hypothetical protein